MSTTLVDEEFRRRLRLIMQQFVSVADLARAVGVSDNAIYKWVSGRGQPSMMSLVNLSKAAGRLGRMAGDGPRSTDQGKGRPSGIGAGNCSERSAEFPTAGERPRRSAKSTGSRLSEFPAGLAAARVQ